ncbi:hypothetical protein H8B09_22645 [Paenibacillus sp. PR3]|uniref:Lipoprotein n=1 Tax=Paenibacillus terricola TaxID=2763503 RepID=A0ABR8N2Z9_9BACL|nr:hypothetical protein [Paenibacillus terricola]MBD3921585.1 hypothetical protein [Paenibacillus terricola]
MLVNKKYTSILFGLFIALAVVLCSGYSFPNAYGNTNSLEEKTSRSVDEFQQNPHETAQLIFNDYFTEIMKTGNRDGVPLAGFTIQNLDISSPDRATASVELKYDDDFGPLPSVEYSVVRINDRYQVLKQVCVYDMDIQSSKYGTVRCTPSAMVKEHSTSISF